MRLLKQLGKLVFCPPVDDNLAVVLYPVALWAAIHTKMSAYAITESYAIAIALLFLLTGFLVDYMYRRFIRERHSKKPANGIAK